MKGNLSDVAYFWVCSARSGGRRRANKQRIVRNACQKNMYTFCIQRAEDV